MCVATRSKERQLPELRTRDVRYASERAAPEPRRRAHAAHDRYAAASESEPGAAADTRAAATQSGAGPRTESDAKPGTYVPRESATEMIMEQLLEAFTTGAGILWKALWALIFGYLISSGIQVLVTREQMGETLGERGPKQAVLAGFFGFISSSCSFAALAASRSVLVKGAHPVNAIAFLVSSTNLVIELGIVLWILLGWQFVLANILLGVLMVVYLYLLTKLWFPYALADKARKHAEQRQKGAQGEHGMHEQQGEDRDVREQLTSLRGWQRIASAFFMEWKMAYREILFGFTVAGFITVFVPDSVWTTLFVQSGSAQTSLFALLEHAALAPVIAFFTFIGSMGNVPLAALLWSKQVSLGGVVSFLGADLVAATVVYIHVKYYGLRYAAFISGLLYVCMVAAGLTVQALFSIAGIVPTARPTLSEQVRFAIDYTFWLNLVFVSVAAVLLWLHRRGRDQGGHAAMHGHATGHA